MTDIKSDWITDHNKKMLEILKKSDNIMMILGASNKNTSTYPEDKDRWENYTPPEFKIPPDQITRVTVRNITNPEDFDPDNKKLLTIIYNFNQQAFYDFLKELKNKIILYIYDYSTTKFADKPISEVNLKIIYEAIKAGGLFIVNIDKSVTTYNKKSTNDQTFSAYFEQIEELKGYLILQFHRDIGLKGMVEMSDIDRFKEQFYPIWLRISVRDEALLRKVGFKVTNFYSSDKYPVPPYKGHKIEELRYFVAEKEMTGGSKRYKIKYGAPG